MPFFWRVKSSVLIFFWTKKIYEKYELCTSILLIVFRFDWCSIPYLYSTMCLLKKSVSDFWLPLFFRSLLFYGNVCAVVCTFFGDLAERLWEERYVLIFLVLEGYVLFRNVKQVWWIWFSIFLKLLFWCVDRKEMNWYIYSTGMQ